MRNQRWTHQGLTNTQKEVIIHGAVQRTVDELSEMSLCDGIATVETDFDIVAVPVGAEMRALVLNVHKSCAATNVART